MSSQYLRLSLLETKRISARARGVDGGDIHTWIDAPWRDLEVLHRRLRHDYDDWIPQRFVVRYGLHLAKAIMRSHIWLDKNWHWYKQSH